jgi:anti-sigma regulatory factor (Ser/Thr protein kinase)
MTAFFPDTPVPDGFREVRRWALDAVSGLARLRADLRAELLRPAPGRPTAEHPEKVVLVASELAANALRHAAPPTQLRLLTDGSAYLVDVIDHAPDMEPELAVGREAGAGGFGLIIVQRLARDVGTYATGTAKHVWARFPSASSAATGRHVRRGA